MASTSGCLCRVPLAGVSAPSFGTSGELLKHLAERGVEVGPDHRGRLSDAVADAQRLHEERARAAATEVAARQREQELDNAARNARLAMRAAYTERRTPSRGVSEEGRAAAEAVLAALPPEVRRRVAPLKLDKFGDVI